MEFKEIKKELGINNQWMADNLDFANVNSYQNSNSKSKYEDFVVAIYNLTKENINKVDVNEIKKRLYKEKPKAYQVRNDEKKLRYVAAFLNGDTVKFEVPLEEGKEFVWVEPAQLLIRWLVK